MLVQFKSLKNIVKVRCYSIDNVVFKLHYRITFYIFLVASILVTSRQYIGAHIKCLTESGVPNKVMDTFCFFTTTFTLPKHYNDTLLKGGSLPHPGVGPMGTTTNEEEIKRHAYYQWVPFVLFGQAILFYLPHILWKDLEGGRLRRLVYGLQSSVVSASDTIKFGDRHIMSKAERDARLQSIRSFLRNKEILATFWSYYLILCEHINFLNVIVQAYFIDQFLGGEFFTLGNYLFENGLQGDISILEYVFPKVTKCTFHQYGPSGTIESHDAMCVMALNIINEKIYVFLWFWLIFLFLCSGLNVLYRYASLLLHSRSKCFNRIVFSAFRPPKFTAEMYDFVTKRLSYREWLFLNYLSHNMDGIVFKKLFEMLEQDDEYRTSVTYEDDQTLLEGEKEILLQPDNDYKD